MRIKIIKFNLKLKSLKKLIFKKKGVKKKGKIYHFKLKLI